MKENNHFTDLSDLNYSAITEDFSDQKYKSFSDEVEAEESEINQKLEKVDKIIKVVIFGFLGIVTIVPIVTLMMMAAISGAPSVFYLQLLPFLLIIIFMAVAFFSAKLIYKKPRKEFTVRANKFAQDNNLVFTDCKTEFNRNSLFEMTVAPDKLDVFSNGEFEFGIVRNFVEINNDRKILHRFYVEKKLNFNIQTLAIDSVKSGLLSVEQHFNSDLVKVEGDFNEYFIIETEPNRKIEATSFLAPDLMVDLIDNYQDCEIEFFDNKVRFYFGELLQSVGDTGYFAEIERKLPRAMNFFEKYSMKFTLLKVEQSRGQINPLTATRTKRMIAKFSFSNLVLLGLIVIFVIFFITMTTQAILGMFSR